MKTKEKYRTLNVLIFWTLLSIAAYGIAPSGSGWYLVALVWAIPFGIGIFFRK